MFLVLKTSWMMCRPIPHCSSRFKCVNIVVTSIWAPPVTSRSVLNLVNALSSFDSKSISMSSLILASLYLNKEWDLTVEECLHSGWYCIFNSHSRITSGVWQALSNDLLGHTKPTLMHSVKHGKKWDNIFIRSMFHDVSWQVEYYGRRQTHKVVPAYWSNS